MRRCQAVPESDMDRTWAASAIGRCAVPPVKERRRTGRNRLLRRARSPAPAAEPVPIAQNLGGDIEMNFTFTPRSARLLLAALLTLGACQSTAPPPADPYLGLIPAGKQVSQAAQTFPISGAKGKSVGFVLTNSTDKQLEFIEKYLHELKTNPMLVYSPE